MQDKKYTKKILELKNFFSILDELRIGEEAQFFPSNELIIVTRETTGSFSIVIEEYPERKKTVNIEITVDFNKKNLLIESLYIF